MIVATTGIVDKNIEDMSYVLPQIELVDSANKKNVFGIISGEIPSEVGEKRLKINAIGDGLIWITNYNGDIENGDLVTSSQIKGYGQKQDDDLFHNYTVAKLTEEIDWDNVEETIDYDGDIYKKVLAACTYHCG